MRRYPFLLTLSALSAAGCNQVKSAAESLENKLFAEPEYKPVEGEDATAALQPVAGAAPFDPAALSQAMDVAAVESSKETLKLLGLSLTADSEEIPEVTGATVDFLNSGAAAKNALKSDAFKQPSLASLSKPKKKGSPLVCVDEIDGYVPSNDKVDLTDAAWGGKNEILSSVTGRVSVKNQQSRGTCAAHAGVGHLEYLIMKKYGSQIAAIDLSEQRFYMLSRSDLWEKGGGVADQDGGSWWPDGFKMSYGYDGDKPPTASPPYNIPLEKDCPYNGDPGTNELQIPQAATCGTGTVRVSNLTTTTYESKNGGPYTIKSGGPRTAQEIFNFIKEHDIPIPISSVLTENWMDNDGMITYAKSQAPGYGPHAGGHAYIIVGMRRLSEAQFPGEGGMCFVIKNSWGTGWGLNGYSCMTLAWWNHFRDTTSFDVALDVEIDMERAKAAAAGTEATSLPPPSDTAQVNQVPAGDLEKLPVIETATDPGEPEGGEPAGGDGGTTPPVPVPPAAADGFSVGRMLAKNGEMMRVLFKREAAKLTMRAVYHGGASVSKDLELKLDGDNIMIDDEPRERKNVLSGDVKGDLVTLCSGKYAQICVLNLVKAENRLVVGLTEAEFRNYEPDPKADYKSLISLAGYGIEAAIGDGAFGDFRFIVKGQTTNPLRLAIKPVSGSIMYQGQEIGNYQKLQFCSGDFGKVCRVLMNAKEKSIKIFFKAKKNP